MINIAKLRYQLILITEDGAQLDITGAAEGLGWEENDGELALRLYFTANNTKYAGSSLSTVMKPGCLIVIMAYCGNEAEEVARGIIQEWDPQLRGSASNDVDITAYDELLYLQKSQDNRYITAGTGTKSAITGIFDEWGIPLGAYDGPDVAHEKTLFKAQYISDMILSLLDDAVKKGGDKCVVRAAEGAVDVFPRGSNTTIYHFDEDTATVSGDSMSITDLVTRVKIVGKEDSDERQPVEAVLDGLTEYGIRQRLYTRSEDATLSEAKTAAQAILDDMGQPQRSRIIRGPDVPMIRKGDMVHIQAGTLDGYYYVLSIQHDAARKTMSMDVEAADMQ